MIILDDDFLLKSMRKNYFDIAFKYKKYFFKILLV